MEIKRCCTKNLFRDPNMYFKITGMVLIIGSSTGIGFLKAGELQKRMDESRQLYHIFKMLESEIKYAGTPLAEAFLHISRKAEAPYKIWMEQLAKDLSAKEGRTFWKSWEKSIHTYLETSALDRHEKEELILFGKNLGYLDREMQTGAIELYLRQLDEEMGQLGRELDARKKLYCCLGVIGGIFLAVVCV